MKIINTLLLLFISSTLFAQQYYQVTTDVLNVRSAADKNSEIISKLNLDDSIYVSEYFKDWSQIQLSDGSFGYVSSKYISKDFKDSSKKTIKEKKEEKTSVWGTLAFLAIIFLAWFFKGSKNSSSSSSKSTPKKVPIFWFMCRYCGTTVRQGSTPSSLGCPTSKKTHYWTKLAEVGEVNYQCRYCGTDVYAKSLPSSLGCPTDKKTHYWTKL